jgi:competence protein ComEA
MFKRLFVVLVACLAFAGVAFAGAAVDLNTATEAQLKTVKGIGPVKAKAVVDYRAKNGPFKSVDDLEKVQGFGKKTVESVRSQVTVGGAAAEKAKPAGDKAEKPKPAGGKAEKAKPATEKAKPAAPNKAPGK